MEELGLYKEHKAGKMERAEPQLHMWDSHFRMITQVGELTQRSFSIQTTCFQ